MDLIQSIYNFFASPLFRFLVNLTVIYIVVLWIATIIWTFKDARKRGAMALTWAAISLAFPFLGVLIYLILRPPEFEEDARLRDLEMSFKEMLIKRELLVCPACHKPIDGDFQTCPYCLKKLKKSCNTCAKLLKLEWVVCPYCKADQ